VAAQSQPQRKPLGFVQVCSFAAPVRFLRFAVCYFSRRASATRLLTSSRAAICQWWHSCMNFERLAGSEPRRCFGDMVSSILIAALRFTDGRFIVSPLAAQCYARSQFELQAYERTGGVASHLSYRFPPSRGRPGPLGSSLPSDNLHDGVLAESHVACDQAIGQTFAVQGEHLFGLLV